MKEKWQTPEYVELSVEMLGIMPFGASCTATCCGQGMTGEGYNRASNCFNNGNPVPFS